MFNKLFLPFFLFTAIILISSGCGEREKDPRTEDEIETNGRIDTSEMMDTSQVNDTTALSKETKSTPDITGTWTGKLDAHTSTLRITEQDNLTFKGRITTNFREVLNQEVSGEFNPETKTLKMRDIHQARSMGTYSAKFSEDMNSMTGTFTLTHDNKNLNFNYSKK